MNELCRVGYRDELTPELQIRYVKLTSIDDNFAISRPNPTFDNLLESSQRDDSNKLFKPGSKLCATFLNIAK